MKRRTPILMILILLCLGSNLLAQQDWNWCFGHRIQMSFLSGGSPIVVANQSRLNYFENGGTMSDSLGRLLFYLDQDSVMDSTHHLMPNGLLLTNYSGQTVTQGTLILPMPGSNRKYYLFQLAWQANNSGGGYLSDTLFLRYSIVNMSLNGGRGDVEFPKEIPIDRGHSLVEKLAAVKHANGKDWWLLVHERDSNAFLSYLVNENGFHGPIRQNIGSIHLGQNGTTATNLGEMCFSQKGDRLLVAIGSGFLDLFDFDRCNGMLSNWVQVENNPQESYYGCSFSSDGNFYYASSENKIWQYDNGNTPTFLDSVHINYEFLGQHQLGPDGRIYVANSGYPTFINNLSVINSPNVPGLGCGLSLASIPCSSRVNYHLPNLPNYNLPPLVAQYAEAGPRQAVICLGDSVQIGYPDTTQGAVTYAWQSHPDIGDTTQPQQWVRPTTSTWYYLTAVDSGLGLPCGKTMDSIHVIVGDTLPYLPLPPNLAGMDRTLCPSDSALLGSSSGLGFEFAWSMGVFPNDTIPAWVFAPGTYVLSIFNPDSLGGCYLGGDTVVVTSFDSLLLPPKFAGVDATICSGDSAVLGSGTGWRNGFIYHWVPSTGVLEPDSLQTFARPTVTTHYVLTATDTSNPGACATVRDTVVVRVEEHFSHVLPDNQVFCPGEVLQIGVEAEAGYSYAWSPVFGLQNPFVSMTSVAPLEAIVYTLTVTSDTIVSENCKRQHYTVALFTDGCALQNVVTPNGDGINDFLMLGSFNGPISISIYDRWGALVFSQDGYSSDWPQSDSRIPEGVYWYVVKVSAEGGKSFVGEVTVLR